MLLNKPVCLNLTTLEISKKAKDEFWYDYMKPKYGEETKLFYMDTDSFLLYIKTEDIYIDITKDVKTRFDTSDYELKVLLP